MVSIDAWRHTTTPFCARASSMPGWTTRPPPQATTTFSAGCPPSMKRRSSSRKDASPSSAKILETALPALRSISWSLSTHLKPIRWATLRPTVVLPVPMKPTRYRFTSSGFRGMAPCGWAAAALLCRSRDGHGRRGRDVQELDLEDEHRARRDAGAPVVAVAELRGNEEHDLPALADLLHALGPPGDDAVERDLERLAGAVGAVEDGAVDERPRVVDLDRVRRLR